MVNGKGKINNKGSKSINVCPYTTGFILMIERGREGERERERGRWDYIPCTYQMT